MTQRPVNRNLPNAVGGLAKRTRDLERLHHGPWIYVGSDDDLPDGLVAPVFQNGWENVGGGLQELRFRWLRNGGVEIQGSVTGGSSGSVIFTLPADPLYQQEPGEIRFAAVDDDDNLVSMAYLPTGDIVHRTGGGGGGITFGQQLEGDCLDIEVDGTCAAADTVRGSYSGLGFAINAVVGDDVNSGDGLIAAANSMYVVGDSLFLQGDCVFIEAGTCGIFFNNQGDYFFNGGYVLFNDVDGFEVDADGIFLENQSSSTQRFVMSNDSPTGEMEIYSTQKKISIFCDFTSRAAMEIHNDGTVHIRSGTAIIADL